MKIQEMVVYMWVAYGMVFKKLTCLGTFLGNIALGASCLGIVIGAVISVSFGFLKNRK